MAVLEIELGLKGFKDGTGDVNSLSSALSNLDTQIAKASANSNELEKELIALNKSFKDGSISQAEYNKSQREVSSALTDTRSALSNLQAQKTSYLQSLKNENSQLITANSTYYEVQKRITQLGKEIKSTSGALNSQSTSVQAKINEYKTLNDRLKTFDSTMGNFQRNVGNYSSALKGSNQVSMEFARIIQDAPFGIMGVGNNIQQLTANYTQYAQSVKAAAAAQGTTVSNMSILKGALQGLLSPLSLLTIGVSLVTAGWTAYNNWSQKSAKATREASKEAKKGNDEYISSLNQLDQARVRGGISAQTELTTLKTLYSIYQDSTLPLNKRKGAYQELQRLYPDYLKNIKFETEASSKLNGIIDKLTASIIAQANARAASDLITKNSERRLLNENKIAQLEIELESKKTKLYQEQITFRNKLDKAKKNGSALDIQSVLATENVTKATKDYEDVLRQINNLKTDSKLLDDQNLKLSENVKTNTVASVNEINKEAKATKQVADYRQQISDIVAKGENKAEVSGESGVFKEITQVENFYEGLYSNLASYQEAYRKKYAEGTAKRLELDKQYEQAVISLNQGMYNAIDKIVSNHNDETLEKLRVKTEKEASQIEDALSKIETIGSTIFTGNKTEIDKQLERTIEQLRKAYEAYEKILKLQGKDTSFLEGAFKTDVMNLEANAVPTSNPTDNKYLDRAVRNAISGVINQTLDSFGDLGKKSYEIEQKYNDLRQKGTKEQISLYNQMERLEKSIATSFTGTISSVFSAVNKGFSDILVKGFSDSLAKMIDDGDFKLGTLSSKTSQAIVAGASIAGGLISSLAKPTSTVGQAVGGAISGAAAGAGIGASIGASAGPIGAVIGGAVGIIAGIFGSKRAKKQEELQKKQLEVQEKQLEEQKRTNALAYSSSIIGQMTNQGIVTGVDRNAFGDIQFEINGKNLVAVMNRNLTANQRGA